MMFTQSIQIKNLTLRNRIVMAPYDTGSAENGLPTEKTVEHYRTCAEGLGLVIVEHAHVSKEGMAHTKQLSMADDSVIAPFRCLTDAVHGAGAKVFAQLSHAGARAVGSGLPAIGPSPVSVRGSEPPAEMTHEDIARIIRCFAEAAKRAKSAGFDGVEIHAAHGYLLNQFYSPLVNQRTDAYCVHLFENRIRLHLQVILAVREAVGSDYPVAIRFGGCDYTEGGSRAEEVPKAVKAFEASGADLIDISGGILGFMRPNHTEPGYFKELSLAAKRAVSVPVILTGGVTSVQEMEQLLSEGAADLIGIGRAINRENHWAKAALESIS